MFGGDNMSWDFFDGINRLQRDFENYFGDFFDRDYDTRYKKNSLTPYKNYRKALADVWENENNIVATVELPGVEKKDIQINARNGGLEIKVEKKSENKKETKNGYSYERTYNGFYRYISLPEYADIDHVKASYKNGVLEITIPKIGSGNSKRIDIE